jgi:phospholipid/cholesterol/gamma-HCH transport system substrate-binding protein
MYSKVNYTIVGIFVLIFTTGLIWFALWLAKYGIHREYDTYKLYMTESVTGLSKDSVVKLRGVDIGHVSEIRIDPKNIEHVEVFLKIKRGVPIKIDMTAHTNMLGITGLLSIEIDGGNNASENLKPTEDYIPIIHTSPSWFNKTKDGLGGLTDDLIAISAKMRKLLTDKNIETIEKILDNSEVFTAKASGSLNNLDDTLKEYKTSIKTMNKNFEEATKGFTKMQMDFTAIKKITIPTVDSLMKTSKDFDRVMIKFEKSLDRGDYNAKKILEPTIVDIGILTEEVSDLARELKQSPSDIFFKSRKHRRGPGE